MIFSSALRFARALPSAFFPDKVTKEHADPPPFIAPVRVTAPWLDADPSGRQRAGGWGGGPAQGRLPRTGHVFMTCDIDARCLAVHSTGASPLDPEATVADRAALRCGHAYRRCAPSCRARRAFSRGLSRSSPRRASTCEQQLRFGEADRQREVVHRRHGLLRRDRPLWCGPCRLRVGQGAVCGRFAAVHMNG